MHTDRHRLMAIFSKPWLASCPHDFQSPVILILIILTGPAKTLLYPALLHNCQHSLPSRILYGSSALQAVSVEQPTAWKYRKHQ